MKTTKIFLLGAAMVGGGLNFTAAQTWVATNPSPAIKAQEQQMWDSSGQTWIKTNLSRPDKSSTEYIREAELTPSVTDEVPNSSEFYNNAARIFLLQKHEGLAIQVEAHAKYGGKIVANYDIRAMGEVNTNGKSDKEVYLASVTNKIHLTAGYYRGRIYHLSANNSNEEWITVFTTEDKTRLALVRDEGPASFSENSGVTWSTIDTPGSYEFTLATTPKGSKIVARVSVAKPRTGAAMETASKMNHDDWYSMVSAADGTRLVISGSALPSAPVLSISNSVNGAIIWWPVVFTNFFLQQNDDLMTTNWTMVANPVKVVGGQNQVIIPQPAASNFYRLKAP